MRLIAFSISHSLNVHEHVLRGLNVFDFKCILCYHHTLSMGTVNESRVLLQPGGHQTLPLKLTLLSVLVSPSQL